MIGFENIVSETSDFSDGGLIYTDKYNIAYEETESTDYIVVYGIPSEDCYDYEFNKCILNSIWKSAPTLILQYFLQVLVRIHGVEERMVFSS